MGSPHLPMAGRCGVSRYRFRTSAGFQNSAGSDFRSNSGIGSEQRLRFRFRPARIWLEEQRRLRFRTAPTWVQSSAGLASERTPVWVQASAGLASGTTPASVESRAGLVRNSAAWFRFRPARIGFRNNAGISSKRRRFWVQARAGLVQNDAGIGSAQRRRFGFRAAPVSVQNDADLGTAQRRYRFRAAPPGFGSGQRRFGLRNNAGNAGIDSEPAAVCVQNSVRRARGRVRT